MTKKNILIVEDEVLIAMQIKDCILTHGYECEGISICFEDAIEILNTTTNIDLVLLDITISGNLTGVDLAHKLNEKYQLPFIYLTSYTDAVTIHKLRATKPVGYLPKPINDVSLTTMLDLHFDIQVEKNREHVFELKIGKNIYFIQLDELLYFKVDHVYVEFFFSDGKKIMVRASLATILELLPSNNFSRINRSTVVNILKVTKKMTNMIFIDEVSFKISSMYFKNN